MSERVGQRNWKNLQLLKSCFLIVDDEDCHASSLLAACVLGDGLGALADSMLGKFTGKEKPDGGLDFPRSDRCLLVVVGETRGFLSNPFEDVVDKRVHDAHGLA